MKNMDTFYKVVLSLLGAAIIIFITHYFTVNHRPANRYPITVQTFWTTNGYQSYPTMECDSVKGDTIWRDGLRIVNKNIINVTFNQ